MGRGRLVRIIGLLGLACLAVRAAAAEPDFIAGSVNFPPWYIEHPGDGGARGIAADLTLVVANRAGFAVRIEPQPNARLAQSLKDGTIDFTLGLDQPGLRQIGLDCGEIGSMSGGIVSLASAPITSLDQLAGKRLGMLRAYRIEPILGPNTGAESVAVEDADQGSRMLLAGRLDGLLIIDAALRHIIAVTPEWARVTAPVIRLAPMGVHIWVSPTSPLKERCQILDHVAATIRVDGLLDRTIDRY